MSLRLHIALPDAHQVARNLRARLAPDGDLAEVARIADRLDDADAVITSTSAAERLPADLPSRVSLLQLIDCGATQRYAGAVDLTIANATSALADAATKRASDHVAQAIADLHPRRGDSPLQFGVVGSGNLATTLIPLLRRQHGAHVGIVWVADIRTPRQQLLDQLGVRRATLDLLMSRSDIVLTAVHRGPTADPLLGARELRLLPAGAWVIDLASESVVDAPDAEDAPWIRNLTIVPTDPTAHERDASENPDAVTNLITENIRAWAHGDALANVVEHLDYPSAGDPAFWSSRMSPSRA